MTTPSQDVAKLAFRFVLVIGIVNFFADMTYEGARSIVGPFLGSLGASAAIVGFVAGFGEMLSYGLRSVSGYFTPENDSNEILTLVIGLTCSGQTGRIRRADFDVWGLAEER